jgi:hypothetical protein
MEQLDAKTVQVQNMGIRPLNVVNGSKNSDASD